MHRFPLLQSLLVCVLLLACDRAPGEAIDRETFVDVYVELRRAAVADSAAVDSAGFRRMRDSILDAHGVDAADLEAFIEQAGPELLSETWTTIAARLEGTDSIAIDSTLLDSAALSRDTGDSISPGGSAD